MKVAVIGAGVSGLVAALTLARAGVRVVIYEQEDYLGGHARTIAVDGILVDVGFMVFNRVTYPNMLSLFEEIGVDIETSDMSFSVSLNEGKGCEWGSNGISGLFAQKYNLFNPFFLRMLKEVITFQHDVLKYLDRIEKKDSDVDLNETLGHFIQSRNYSQKFQDCYLVPMCASIWSCSSEQVLHFSAVSVLTFCRNHHLLQLFGRPQWLTVQGRSRTYVTKILAELETKNCRIQTSCSVTHVFTSDTGVHVVNKNGEDECFDKCIIGTHAPDALEILGGDATIEERCILGAFHYSHSDIYLHQDLTLMPRRCAAWCSWNFLGCQDGRVCVTYWLNKLQNLKNEGLPILVTLNPPKSPLHTVATWRTSHPIPSPSAVKAAKQLDAIQGKRGIWFCGAYQGYGFHEDGLKSGLHAAKDILGGLFEPLKVERQTIPSWSGSLAQMVVKFFLQRFIQIGHLQIVETNGNVADFVGDKNGHPLKCILQVHRSEFYWKVATRADLGLADAFINEDFTCVNPENGLLHLFLILIANRDIHYTSVPNHKRRSWWNPLLFTAAVGSAISYLQHLLRSNSITKSRHNISAHYDMSNSLFALFLDETMTYSCAIFKGPTDPLKLAQLRKINRLINKAQIKKNHQVLEIGFGWGSMALEVVKRTGCKFTGITLSEEQLKLAQKRVNEAGLQDQITFELCDYREFPGYKNYDRILSCEMLEAVGHEHLKEFFNRCDHLLANDGILVVQVITIPDARYEEYRTSSDFIKEYIFPGGCLPAFSTLTTAMATGSSLCVQHVEEIGIHYAQTLLSWRERFHLKHSEILGLGFDQKFLRMWEYYFIYCAAGFKSCTLNVLQIVFSRPGNVSAFGNPYKIIQHD
eukprot:c27949_g1_i1 orf=349-2943(+)